jgi:beta-phosphoglucomutase
MIKAILYDLDGVLIDACDWHKEALNKALKQLFNYEIGLEDHIKTFNGLPTIIKAKILKERGIIPKGFNIEELNKLKQEYTVSTIKQSTGIDIIKKQLHEGTKKFKKACVTNSITMTTELMLKSTGQLKYMDAIITNQKVKNAKPHPEPYIRAMIELNCMPDECLIIEDSPKGIECAKLTGCHIFKVKNATEVTLQNVLTKIQQINNEG